MVVMIVRSVTVCFRIAFDELCVLGMDYTFDWRLITHPLDYSGEMEGKHSKTLKLSKVRPSVFHPSTFYLSLSLSLSLSAEHLQIKIVIYFTKIPKFNPLVTKMYNCFAAFVVSDNICGGIIVSSPAEHFCSQTEAILFPPLPVDRWAV